MRRGIYLARLGFEHGFESYRRGGGIHHPADPDPRQTSIADQPLRGLDVSAPKIAGGKSGSCWQVDPVVEVKSGRVQLENPDANGRIIFETVNPNVNRSE
jgi:hypothetical protein